MIRCVPLLVAALLPAGHAFAQPQFEVASIKFSTPQSLRGSEGGPGSKDPTHYRFQSATLQDLIGIAWHVQYFQISSRSSVDKDRYDLIANVPAGATRDDFRLMLRALLAEQFQLKTHTETRDFAAFELVIAKNGLKMRENVPGAPIPSAPEGFPQLNHPGLSANFSMFSVYQMVRMRGVAQTSNALLGFLRVPGNEPIVDKTGLSGKYDFTLEYTIEPARLPEGADPPAAPDVFTAAQEQLGLQLVAKKLPFDVVVVESFDRTPAGN